MAAPQVTLHRLSGTKKALDACRLVEKCYQAGKKVVVWFQDEGRAAIFDQYLWTFSDTAFIPHKLVSPGSPVEEPVALVVGALHNPCGAEVLVVLEQPSELAAAQAFPQVHDLLLAGEERREQWEKAGFAVTEVKGI